MSPSAAALALWRSPLSSSATVERWEQLRAQHADLQRRAGVASGDAAKLARLSALDADFVLGALPQKLQAAKQKLTKDDLVKMVEWKLLRGKWRPALLGYAMAQTDAAVGAAAAKALAALGGAASSSSSSSPPPTDAQTRAALDALCALRGVGPATASIVLCAATGGQVPYMADEALEAAVGAREYTAGELLALARALRARARELTTGKAGSGKAWTAEDVQRALHAAELEARAAKGAKGATEATTTMKTKTKTTRKKTTAAAAATSAPPAAAKRQRRR